MKAKRNAMLIMKEQTWAWRCSIIYPLSGEATRRKFEVSRAMLQITLDQS